MRAPVILAALAVGCTPAGPTARTLRVLAASSLQDAFEALSPSFAAAHDDTRVELVFAGSHTLAAQVRHGLDADVIASADPRILDALAAEGLAAPARTLARNTLVLAVGDTAPDGLGLDRLPEAQRIVLGVHTVPVGRYADELLASAAATRGAAWHGGVQARVVSREPDARRVAAKVSLGEADAAIVYATDVRGLPGIRAVALPVGLGPVPDYASSVLAGASEPGLAAAWEAYTRSPEGQATLRAHGLVTEGP